MFKKKSYLYVLGGLFLVYIIFMVLAPRPINWKHTYSKRHKYPYGNFATVKLLENIFPDQEVLISREPPYTYLQDQVPGYNFILVTEVAKMGDEDAIRLLDYIHDGANAFIAAEYFTGLLADTLGIQTNVRYSYDFVKGETDSVTVNFSNPKLKRKEEFRFQKYEVQSYFDESYMDSDYYILGEASDSTVNFIKIPFGEGSFYLHSNPLIFTNYNLLHRYNHHEYISKSWSYLPLKTTIWDEYYNSGREGGSSDIRYILSRTELRWAWFTILAFTILFFLFHSKRRQRIIPILKPLQNTTLEFVNTVGRLYFQQKDHTNLARKKAKYFLEDIRKKFYLRTNELDEEFIKNLSIKSGVDETSTRIVIQMIKQVYTSPQISEKQLIDFNKAIENFNLKSKS